MPTSILNTPRWWLIIEKFSPELIYLKGETNIVADALSKLEMNTSKVQNEDMQNMHYLAKHFALDDMDLPDDAYPLHYKLIAQHQNSQKDLFIKLNKKQDGFSSQILLWRW